MNTSASLSWDRLAVWVIVIIVLVLMLFFMLSQLSTEGDGILSTFLSTLFEGWN